MSFSVQYDKENDRVVGCIAGSTDIDTFERFGEEAARIVSQHNCRRFLNDLRGMEPHLSTLDIYYLPRTLGKLGLDHRWRRAIVVSRHTKDLLFFENVCANLAYPVKVFVDLDEAINWLEDRSA
jgi:hypothetical protein